MFSLDVEGLTRDSQLLADIEAGWQANCIFCPKDFETIVNIDQELSDWWLFSGRIWSIVLAKKCILARVYILARSC